MKNALLTTFLATSAQFCLHADNNPANPNRIDYLEATVNDLKKQVATLKEEVKDKGIPPTASPLLNGGCDAFITGDFLYWKANESDLAYVLRAKVEDATLNLPGNGNLVTPNFGWDPGFRVGLGWRTNHDDWDLYLTWTRFHTAAHSHRHTGNGQNLFPTLAGAPFAASICDSATTHLLIHLNAIDIEVGRQFYVGKHLSLRPHIGFENIWISQHYNTKYKGLPLQESAFEEIRFRNNFWGFGIRSGMDTQWNMRWGFSLFGDVAFALLYGEFDLKRTSKHNFTFRGSPLIGNTHVDEKPLLARVAMELALGLKWETLFIHDRFHFSMQAGWEEHFYFGQNQMYNFFGTADESHGKETSANGDLSLQGLTISARLDF